MTGLAGRVKVPSSGAHKQEWAPFRVAALEDEGRARRRFSGLGVLAAFLIFSGVTVAVALGQAGLVGRYGISEESLIVAVSVIQGAAALSCFVLAVRWLRS